MNRQTPTAKCLKYHECKVRLNPWEAGQLCQQWNTNAEAASEYFRATGGGIRPIPNSPGVYNSCASGELLQSLSRPSS